MTTTFYRPTLDDPLKLSVAPTPIRPAAAPPPLPAVTPPATGTVGYLHAYANESNNSRSRAAMPAGPWRVRWQADLGTAGAPSFVLALRDRALVQGATAWNLFDAEGRSLRNVALGAGNMTLDPGAGLFYYPDSTGLIVACQLSDAAVRFMFFPEFGRGYRHNLVTRRGRWMLVSSFELPQMSSQGMEPPALTGLEVYDLGERFEINEEHLLESQEQRANLISLTQPLVTALGAQHICIAVPNHVYLADRELKVVADLSGEFEPLTMSLDEGERIYLVVRSRGKHALWILNPDGVRLAAAELPGDFVPGACPPIIGYDHRTYLVGEKRVLAVNPDGSSAWDFASDNPCVGALVTADHRLLISAGDELRRLDNQGQATTLHTFDEPLATPPVLNGQGEILVASQRRLYCLTGSPPPTR